LSPLQRSDFNQTFEREVDAKVRDIRAEVLPDDDPILKNDITLLEVTETVKHLNVRKAPGPDLITNEHIKYANVILSKHLTQLFNMITWTCYSPEMLRTGIIIPIYKGNSKDRTDPTNYRGITLTSAIGKIFERILLDRITSCEYLCEPDFPHALQCGFRKEHGALNASHIIQEVISYYTDRQTNVYTAFLDK
jgi:hypothetical protein